LPYERSSNGDGWNGRLARSFPATRRKLLAERAATWLRSGTELRVARASIASAARTCWLSHPATTNFAALNS